MEKRVPLALFLCFLAIVVFNLTQPPPQQQPKTLPPIESGSTTGDAVAEVAHAPDRVAAEVEEIVELEFGRAGAVGHFRATFSNLGARLLQLDCGNYTNSEESPLGDGSWVRLLEAVEGRDGLTGSLQLSAQPSSRKLFTEPLESVLWQMEVERSDDAPVGVTFRYSPGGGWVLRKTIRPVEDSYEFTVDIAVERAQDASPFEGPLGFRLTPAACVGIEFPDSFYEQPSAVAVGGADGKLKADTIRSNPSARDLQGALDIPLPVRAFGAHNKYFAVIMRAHDTSAQAALSGAAFRRIEDSARVEREPALRGKAYDYVVADAFVLVPAPPAGQERTWRFDLYAGPKDEAHFITDAEEVHERVLKEDLSYFSGIGRFLSIVLRTLENATGNWGWAIILLTLLIRSALFPLNRRAQTAMARYQSKMKRVQPKLEELKKRYENDPQTLRQEQAKMMQSEGAFPPLGGCLPIFLQLPIFFGLFAALRTSFDLRQAPFLGYIDDLSRPDQLYEFASAIPLIGITHLNLLPILMVILWVLQQKTMPKPTDENAQRMQRIMLFMPVVMGVFLYNYAAGLSLYMMTQSTLGIVEQKIIKKYWPVDDKEQPRKAKAGCAPLAKRMQELAEQQQKRVEATKRQQGSSKGKKRR